MAPASAPIREGSSPAWVGETQPPITVVVPALNEASSIGPVVLRLTEETDVRVIVSDGGSSDHTRRIAEDRGAETISVATGRSAQMNQAAELARPGILVFVHADTELPEGWSDIVRGVLADPRVVLGAFRFSTDLSTPSMRFLEWLVWLRCRVLHQPYGDQGLFVRTDDFAALGGFPDLPLLEDYEFVRHARRRGRVVTSPERALTSGRLWRELGPWRMTWRNMLTLFGHHLGIAPERLAAWRRRPVG